MTAMQKWSHLLRGNTFPPPPPSVSASESESEYTTLLAQLTTDNHALAKALTERALRTPLVFDSPSVNLDVSGVALSFLPCPQAEDGENDILALRARLFSTLASHGVSPHMRYALPSAHITVARFVDGLEEGMDKEEWVRVVEGVNEELGRWGVWIG